MYYKKTLNIMNQKYRILEVQIKREAYLTKLNLFKNQRYVKILKNPQLKLTNKKQYFMKLKNKSIGNKKFRSANLTFNRRSNFFINGSILVIKKKKKN